MAGVLSDHDRRLLTDLNAEWCRLVETECDIVAMWAARRPSLARCGDLAACIAGGRARDDAVLTDLLAECEAGDDRAGRTVLQARLPAMVRMSCRDGSADLTDYVGALWGRIRTYPLGRRPKRIANNLELDALKSICADRSAAVDTPADDDQLEALWRRTVRPASDEPTAVAVISAALGSGLIDEPTARLLRTVYADGLSGRAAAARHHTTVDLVRWRCSKTLRTLAQHAPMLAAA